jgi:hypothetical protein
MRVRKVDQGYYARVGDFFGTVQPSSQEAISALDQELEQFRPLNQHYVVATDGTVLHIFQIPSHGWNVNIITPHGWEGKGMGVHGTYRDAQERALRYAREQCGGVIADGMVRPPGEGVGQGGGRVRGFTNPPTIQTER